MRADDHPTPVRLGCRGSLLSLIELLDLDLASLGEDSRDLQLPSHGANEGLERADVHISAPFHLGYGGPDWTFKIRARTS